MKIRQETSLILFTVWSIINSTQIEALTSRNGIKNVAVWPTSMLRASNVDSIASIRSGATKPVKKKAKTAVIVGGGPGGLSAAMALSKVRKPGTNAQDEEPGLLFERIIVLDERPKESYDPSRAYAFNINVRGQRFTDAFGIDLSKLGVPITYFKRQVVPSDPNEVFEGETPKVSAVAPKTDEERKNMLSYNIQRHELLQLIMDEIHLNNEKDENAIIEVREDARCERIEPTEDGLVKIVLAEMKGVENSIVADLCVGADGVSSAVRQSLEAGRFDAKKWSNAKNPSKTFRLKQYASPSTGLRLKALKLNPGFAIPKGGTGSDCKTEIPLDSQYIMYRLESATKGSTDTLPLSIFAQKDNGPATVRILQIVTEPSHDIWNPDKIDSGLSMKAYFQKAHPRYDWDNVVSEEEWETFFSSRGLRFPLCQYAPSMYVSSNSNESGDDYGAGVVLVGDALHAFPPDLGQGVNVAMCDATVLGKSFEKAAAAPKSTNSFVSEALKLYQDESRPEIHSLIKLVQVGFPLQYDQSSRKAKVQKKLWFANVTLRLFLNKVTFGLSPIPAMFSLTKVRITPDSIFVRTKDILLAHLLTSSRIRLYSVNF